MADRRFGRRIFTSKALGIVSRAPAGAQLRGGATLKFDKLLAKGAEIIEEAPAPEQPPTAQEKQETEAELKKSPSTELRQMDGSDPGDIGMIISIAEAVEAVLRQLSAKLGGKSNNGFIIMEFLRRRGFVTEELVALYQTLRDARNAVVHGRTIPNKDAVREYVRQVNYLHSALLVLLAKLNDEKA